MKLSCFNLNLILQLAAATAFAAPQPIGPFVRPSQLPANVRIYGAKGDGVSLTDASITSGSNRLTSPTAAFGAGDVGKPIAIGYAGTGGTNTLVTTIASYVSGTSVLLTGTAYATVSGTAQATYGTNDTSAIIAAIAGANAVYLPAGHYIITGTNLNVSKPMIFTGDGSKSIIRQLDPNQLGLNIHDTSGVTVRDVSFGHAALPVARTGGPPLSMVEVTDAVISGVRILSSAAVGLNIEGCSRVTVSGCTVTNTLADGIFVHAKTYGSGAYCQDITVTGCHTSYTGDDGISCVSMLAAAGRNRRISYIGNTVQYSLGRGLSVSGGQDCTYSGNVIENTSSAGLYVNTNTAFGNYGCTNVILSGNVIRGANTYVATTNAGGIAVSSGDVANPVENITISDNIIYGGGYWMIRVGDASTLATYNVQVTGNQCIGPNTAAAGISIEYTWGVFVSKNRVQAASAEGIVVASTCSGAVVVTDNVAKANNQSGTSSVRQIRVQSVGVSGTTGIVVARNVVLEPNAATGEQVGITAGEVTLSSNVTKWAVPDDHVIVTSQSGTNREIQSIADGYQGRRLSILNTSTNTLTLKHEQGGTTSAQRLNLPSGASVDVPPNGSATLLYEGGSTNRWQLADVSGSLMLTGGTSAVPAVTGTVAAWKSIQVSGSTYKIPLYQ